MTALMRRRKNFGLEGLDNGKTAETIGEGGGEEMILIGNTAFGALQAAAGEQGSGQGQCCDQNGDGCEQGGIAEHYSQRAHKGDGACNQLELLGQIVRLDGRSIIGEGRKVGGGAFITERSDALFRETAESKIAILHHGAANEARCGGVAHKRKRKA